MENKKQLIIIPPMSEALRKLNEVLESISAEENMEITVIDDLKELTQFLGTTGQCLILASNAKKCATFLQDNKSLLAKFHCKTILFTPKEIPAKTLIKFTKVGLTESILESSPPKTFVYKVKLLLRSIKTVKPQEDAEKVVKSLDNKAMTEEAEKETKEKDADVEISIDPAQADKKKFEDASESIDYDTSIKGKNRHQDEAIDTNWRSGRKRDETASDSVEEPTQNKALEEQNNIDMYYRGKQQKNVDIVFEEDPYAKAKRAEEGEALDVERRKRAETEILMEGAVRKKPLEEETHEDNNLNRRNIQQTDISLDFEKKEKEEAQSSEEKEKKKAYIELGALTEAAKEKEGASDPGAEDEDPLKGRTKDIDIALTEEEAEDPEMDYVAARRREKKNTEIEFAVSQKERKQNSEEEESERDRARSNIDLGSSEGDFNGSDGVVEKIETNMSAKVDKEQGSLFDKEDDDLDLAAKRAPENQGRDLRQESMLENLVAEADFEEAPNLLREDDPERNHKKSSLDAQLEADEALRERDAQAQIEEEEERERSSLLENARNEKGREKMIKEDDKEIALRSLDKNDPLAKKERDHSHNGHVEKIDTFYRSGEAKKNDQNWDDLHKRNASIDLLLAKNTRAPDGVIAKDQKEFSEVTIDYRKLKEEFDMMASGGTYSGEDRVIGTKAHGEKDEEDSGSFKVIEIDSKSLDFAVNVISAIYDKDMQPKKIFALMCSELLRTYHAYPVFYTYKLGEKKFVETYNIFTAQTNDLRVTNEIKEWWHEFKKDTAMFEHYQSKSMTTWRCAEIIKENVPWEDVELPSWADQELKDRKVELIFPYYDGIDRMGLAVVFLPEGMAPKKAMGLLTLLEMARTLFLDTIERYQVTPVKSVMDETPAAEDKIPENRNVLSFITGLFGKKKAG